MGIVITISTVGANSEKIFKNQYNNQNSQIQISTTTPYKVIKVVDGDTFYIQVDNKKLKIRMLGIDTPETKDPRKIVQCFGKEASDKTKGLILNKYVKLENDITQAEYDKYNRFLAYVYLDDNSLLNSKLIKEGYAHEYTYKVPYLKQAEFKNLEKEAREGKRGLWGDKCSK